MPNLATELVHLLLTPLAYVIAACWLAALLASAGATPASAGRHRPLLIAAGTLFYLWSVPALPARLTAYTEALYAAPDMAALQEAAGPAPRVLVLSAGWFRQSPEGPRAMLSADAWERTRAGVEAWRRLGGTLIFSGGPVPDGSDSVAAQMARAAEVMGVPAARVLVEPASRNTRENIAFSVRMLGLHSGEPVVLVTSALHMPRAVAWARMHGIAALAYPCDWRGEAGSTWRDWLPSNGAPGAWQDLLHEWVGIVALRMGVAP